MPAIASPRLGPSIVRSVARPAGGAATDCDPRRHASDWALAESVLQALFPGPLLRRERIGVAVAAGQVTLSGTVATAGERSAAERAARGVDGVDDVLSLVAVQAQEWTAPTFLGPAAAYGRDGESGSVAGRIEALFERDAEIDGTRIGIAAQGGRVVLAGTVRSWRERDLAERVAWSAPGVTEVEDRMIVLRNTTP